MTETTVAPSVGIDPVGDAALALNALAQMGTDLGLLRRVEAGLNEAVRAREDAQSAVTLERQRADVNAGHMAAAREEAAAARRDLRGFRIKVRDKAIEVAQSEGWCIEGLNEALEDLGLDPAKRTFDIRGKVRTADRDFSWQIEAATEEEAREKMKELLTDDTDHSAYDDAFDLDVDFHHVGEGELA
jgi:hypothetical protein